MQFKERRINIHKCIYLYIFIFNRKTSKNYGRVKKRFITKHINTIRRDQFTHGFFVLCFFFLI